MSTVKVWNDGPTPYSEMFRENEISIPKGGHVEMDYFDAVQFLGQYIKPKKLGEGLFANHKMLRIEGSAPDLKSSKHTCQLCKGDFTTEKELLLHSDQFHKAVMHEDDDKPKRK